MSVLVDSSSDLTVPDEVLSLLNESAKQAGVPRLLAHILEATNIIGATLRNCGYSSTAVGTTNDFGDKQLDVDVKTDAVIFDYLTRSMLVKVASSEENPTSVPCNGEGFSVAFDPLDGSSIIDANFAVGTILGAWFGDSLINRCGREQVFSLVVQYGPRVTAALAINLGATLTGQPICLELTRSPTNWFVSIPVFSILPSAKTFAPGNLRATFDNDGYKNLVNYWIANKYTLRYSGGLVPDIYHILIKGQGVLANASSKSAKAKLRLLYECAPIALIIEAAGGSSCVCASEAAEPIEPISLLDVVITELDKRVGVCYGSTEEVERFKSFVFV
eukprot:gene6552-9001_t